MGFHALLWEPLSRLARGFPRIALGKLCCVTSPGSRVGISEAIWCWFCVEMEASLRRLHSLWFTRALFVSAGLKVRVQRAVLPALESEFREQEELQERFERGSRESARTLARRFNQSDLDTAHRQLVESECRYGAEPRPCPGFLPAYTLWRKINFYPCIKTLTRFTLIISPHSLSYWFIHFCNRSYKSKHCNLHITA